MHPYGVYHPRHKGIELFITSHKNPINVLISNLQDIANPACRKDYKQMLKFSHRPTQNIILDARKYNMATKKTNRCRYSKVGRGYPIGRSGQRCLIGRVGRVGRVGRRYPIGRVGQVGRVRRVGRRRDISHHAPPHSTTLYHTPPHSTTLYHTPLHSTTLHHTLPLHYSPPLHHTPPHSTTLYHSTTPHHSTTPYPTILSSPTAPPADPTG